MWFVNSFFVRTGFFLFVFQFVAKTAGFVTGPNKNLIRVFRNVWWPNLSNWRKDCCLVVFKWIFRSNVTKEKALMVYFMRVVPGLLNVVFDGKHFLSIGSFV